MGCSGCNQCWHSLGRNVLPFPTSSLLQNCPWPHGLLNSPTSDGLNVDYLWVRKQDLDGGIVRMELSNPAPSVFKSSLRVCITSLLFASTKEQQQETLKPNGKGIALTWDTAQPCSMQSKVSPQHTAWPGIRENPRIFFSNPKSC